MVLRALLVALALFVATACESTPEAEPTTGTSPVAGVPGGVTGGPVGGGYGGSGGYGSAGVGAVQSGGSGALSSALAQVERELAAGGGDTVYFSFDSYALDGAAQQTLDRQAAILLRNPTAAVTVEGHCDERGTREYNLALGERRATSVKDYLVAFGISPNRIRTISYGKERPAVVGDDEAAWSRNRRAVTIVTGSAAGS